MPTTFAQFKEDVLALYQEKKIRQELDDLLVNPSPAKLRDYCLIRLSEGLPSEDIEVFQKFFDPLRKQKSLEEAIATYNTGSLKALQKFTLNITQDPEDRVVKLLAILVDYQPRPFRSTYSNVVQDPICDASEEIKHSTVKEDKENVSFPISEPQLTNSDKVILEEEDYGETTIVTDAGKDNVPTVEENDKDKENENIEEQVHSQKKIYLNKQALTFIGLTSMVVLIFFAVNYFKPKNCMCWNGKEYVQVDCEDRTQRYQVIGLDKEKLDRFKKITELDTLTEEDIDHIWYSKIDNEVEFFTAPGRHPTQPHKSLKAVTKYIWNTRMKEKSGNDPYKQLGIMKK